MNAEQSTCASSGPAQHWRKPMPSSGQKAASLYREGPTTMVVGNRSCSRRALSRLEPYVPKGSSTVPRGEGGRKAILLPDSIYVGQ
jgi:hypothetical protein